MNALGALAAGTALAVTALAPAARAAVPAGAAAAMPPTVPSARTSLLFSVLSPTSTVTVSPYSTSLSLPAAATMAWFTDRPARRAGTATVGDLARMWAAYGFASVPPNAVIVTAAQGARMQVPVTLSRPTTQGPVVTFRVTPLPAKASVAGMRAMGPALAAGTYGDTSVFIDDSQPGPLAVTAAAFGTVKVGRSKTITLTATNTEYRGITWQRGVDVSGPATVTGGSCFPLWMLAQSASCTIDITWAPQAAGDITGNVTVTYDYIPTVGADTYRYATQVSITGTAS